MKNKKKDLLNPTQNLIKIIKTKNTKFFVFIILF
jgi:hypothetical protein